jgi:hypothetical protein
MIFHTNHINYFGFLHVTSLWLYKYNMFILKNNVAFSVTILLYL